MCGSVGQAGHGVFEGVVRIVFDDVVAVDIGEDRATVGAHLIFGDRAVSRIVPSQSGLAVFALRDREVRRGGPQGNSIGVGRIAVSGSVHRAYPQCVLGAVGQAGYGVGGGGPTAAADVGEVPAAVGSDLVLPDGVVARIDPGQRDLAVTHRSREARRFGRWRARRRGRGGCLAGTGNVPRAQLERVLGAVGQAGHGVFGGVHTAAVDVRPRSVGAVVAVRHLRADLVSGDRVAARIGPGQRDRAVTRHGQEARRGGRERRGGHGGCCAVATNILRTHRKRVRGAAGEAGHGVSGGGRIGVGDGDVRPRSVGAVVAVRHLRADLVSGDRVVARIAPVQRHLVGFIRRGREVRGGRKRRGGHGGCCAVAANILRTHRKRVRGAAGEAGHGVAVGARTAAADIGPVAVVARACFPAILVLGDRVVGRIVPGQRHLGFTRRGREVLRRRRGQGVPLDPDLYRS